MISHQYPSTFPTAKVSNIRPCIGSPGSSFLELFGASFDLSQAELDRWKVGVVSFLSQLP